MVKVLQVFPQMNNAGTEKVIMNLFYNIDLSKVEMEFLVQKEGELDEEIKKRGAKIHYIQKTTPKEYQKELERFFANNRFTAVHSHHYGTMGDVFKAARKVGIKHCIAHSHGARADLPSIARVYKIIRSYGIIKHTTQYFACSVAAAQWSFPTKWRKCKIIYNGIDLETFQFNEGLREKKRSELGFSLTDKVVCHVGRFSEEKNHKRLIEILNEMIQGNSDVKAVFIGDGPLFSEIRDKNESENIKFLGSRTDVHELLNVADIFVLPSLHEGLPFVLVEAQVNGLPCIASDTVSAESDIGSGLLTRLSLKVGNDEWISHINRAINENNRKEKSQLAYKSKFNVKQVGKEMEAWYLNLK